MVEELEIGRVERVELRVVGLPLVAPFATAAGARTTRDVLLVRVDAGGVAGWGECAAFAEPSYTAETIATARHVLAGFLVPVLGGVRTAGELAAAFSAVRGHPMARAALESAVLDLVGRRHGQPLWRLLGGSPGTRPAGVAIGLQPSVGVLVDAVGRALAEGYRQVKLKVHPGWDVEPVRAVRSHFPDLGLWVDGNGSYGPGNLDALLALDELGLRMIEQPLPADDLVGLARLGARLGTPLGLDESVESVGDLEAAAALGAARVLNLKPGRVGGMLAARQLARRARELGLEVFVGGMLESGLGRTGCLHLQTLGEVTLDGDLSAPGRYLQEDLVKPSPGLDARGCLPVPSGPGTGVEVLQEVVDRLTLAVEVLVP
ncbi:MAG: o-succinylbenzoate synthase [Thermoanaerobaculaceae bacterium]|jgi:O-succinylbenzoate synthase|nr:o-succinylbenzoate synthase [Thermoanaerobaculaceae bacterium]